MRSEQLGPLSGPWARVPKQRRRGQRAKKKLQNFESYHLSSWKSNSTNLCTVYAHSMHMGSEYWHGLQHPSWVKRPITAFTELMVPTTTPTPLITFGSSQITQKHFFLQGQVLRNDPKHIKNAISFFFSIWKLCPSPATKKIPRLHKTPLIRKRRLKVMSLTCCRCWHISLLLDFGGPTGRQPSGPWPALWIGKSETLDILWERKKVGMQTWERNSDSSDVSIHIDQTFRLSRV